MNITIQIKPKYWGNWESPETHTRSSILTPYLLKVLVNLDNTTFQDRGQLWFNPALFIELNSGYTPYGGEPRTGYFIELPSFQNGDTFTMPLKSNSGQAKLVNKNYKCEVKMISNTSAEVTFDFSFLADRNGYLDDALYTPTELALQSIVLDNSSLNNSIPNVYNQLADLGVYVFYRPENENEDAEFADEELKVTSRFFNEGIRLSPNEQQPSEYTNPQIKFLDDDGNRAFELNPYEEYDLKLSIDGSVAPTAGLVYLFEEATNYPLHDTVFAELPLIETTVEDRAGNNQLEGAIHAPSSNWALSGSTYEASFKVLGSKLKPNTTYRVAFVVANDSYSNTFISEVVNSSNRPSAYPNLNSLKLSIHDYHTGEGSDIIGATVVDRYEARFSVDVAGYFQQMQSFNYSNGYAVDELLSIEFQILDFKTKKVLESAKGSLSQYELQTNDADLRLTSTFPNIEFRYQLRALFENEAGFEDYGGDKVIIRGIIGFAYPENGDEVLYVLDSTLKFRNFDNYENQPLITNVKFLDPDTNEEVGSLQSYGKTVLKVESVIDQLSAGITGEYRWMHHVFTDKYPFGSNALSDQFLKGQQKYIGSLAQEENPAIIQQDVQYDPATKKATLLIDLDELDLDDAQRLYVVAKPSPIIDNEEMQFCEREYAGLNLTSIRSNCDPNEMGVFEIDLGTYLDLEGNSKLKTFYDFAYNNYASSNPDYIDGNPIPFVIWLNMHQLQKNRFAKVEIIEVDPDGNRTVVATTGTNSNNGPFQDSSNTSLDPSWYLNDDGQIPQDYFNRIEEFENQWNVHFGHGLGALMNPDRNGEDDCTYNYHRKNEKTENRIANGELPLWFSYDIEKINEGYNYLLVSHSNVLCPKVFRPPYTYFESYLIAELFNCEFTKLCGFRSEDFMRSGYGAFVLIQNLEDSGVSGRHVVHYSGIGLQADINESAPYTENLWKYRSYNNFVSSIDRTNAVPPGQHRGFVSIQYDVAGSDVIDPKVRIAQEISGQLKRVVAADYPDINIYQSHDFERSINVYWEELQATDWCRFNIAVKNIQTPPITNHPALVEFNILQGASITHSGDFDVAVIGGSVIHQETLANLFVGDQVFTREFNLNDGETYQIVVNLIDQSNRRAIVAFDLIPTKS